MKVYDVLCRHLCRLSDLLRNADVDIRICAGEAIALLYELAWTDDEVGTAVAYQVTGIAYAMKISFCSV